VDSICIVEGLSHVVIYANDVCIETAGFDPTGMPAREAWVGWEHLQDLMDRTLISGRSYFRDIDGGTFVSLPYRRDGAVVGVLCGFRLAPVSVFEREAVAA
jgi:hypothetical protein